MVVNVHRYVKLGLHQTQDSEAAKGVGGVVEATPFTDIYEICIEI